MLAPTSHGSAAAPKRRRQALRVFVAGGTGALGRQLLPVLRARGHAVTATTRKTQSAETLRQLGAEPVIVDALDAEALRSAVVASTPDVVVHQLTDLTSFGNIRRFAAAFESTNELRTAGTDNLLVAARAAGAKRFVAQSFGGWVYGRTGGFVKSEEDPLDPHPFPAQESTLAAIRHLEHAVTGAADLDGLALRYGAFYGPGTSLGIGGEHLELVRRRRFPIIGSGGGHWSFIQITDAARATANAVEGGPAGIYNIVDDEPAAVSTWLPELAKGIGAKPPRRVPRLVGRIAAGPHGVAMLTEVRGASNAKANRLLAWSPRFASWRSGFQHGLAEPDDQPQEKSA